MYIDDIGLVGLGGMMVVRRRFAQLTDQSKDTKSRNKKDRERQKDKQKKLFLLTSPTLLYRVSTDFRWTSSLC